MPQRAGVWDWEKENNPYVEIVEQPASKSLRFRYECEGRATGNIPGSSSTVDNRTFPTIRVVGWRRGRGIVVVSCVTKDKPYMPHPHNLIGKDMCEKGVCRMKITADKPEIQFANLGIQCVKKKHLYDALRVRKELRIDPFRTGFDHMKRVTSMDLNSVRLCFQVFIEGRDGKINVPLRPVLSEPIYDKKSMSDLVICKMSHDSATVEGGTEIILLCEKVSRDNIQVRFFETLEGRRVWESLGQFKSMDVHKQVAINFRTPSYRHRNVEEPVRVYVELTRPSDGLTSEAWPFRLLPIETCHFESEFLRRKRRRFDENPEAQRMMRQLQNQGKKELVFLDDTSTIAPNFYPTDFPTAPVRSFPVSPPFSPALDLVAPSGDRTSTTNGAGNAGGNGGGDRSLLPDLSCYGTEALPGTLPSHMAYDSHDIPPCAIVPTPAVDSSTSQFHATQNIDADRFNQFDDWSLNFNRQTHCQQTPATICHENFAIPDEVLDDVVGEAICTDVTFNFHDLLDSGELAAYAAAFTEGGIAMADNSSTKKDTNGGSGARWATEQFR